jgi:hypothetical protein
VRNWRHSSTLGLLGCFMVFVGLLLLAACLADDGSGDSWLKSSGSTLDYCPDLAQRLLPFRRPCASGWAAKNGYGRAPSFKNNSGLPQGLAGRLCGRLNVG